MKKNVFTIITRNGEIIYTRSKKAAEKLAYNKDEIYFINNEGFIIKVK